MNGLVRIGIVTLFVIARVDAAEIRVHPDHVTLDHGGDVQRLIVTRMTDDGVTVDVTDEATFEPDDDAVVATRGGRLVPVGDGHAEVSVKVGEDEPSVAVSVRGSDRTPSPRFRADVVPILTRAGCNTGSCHGASRGKDGFHLSLFGYDPAGDHHRITREMGSRRINPARVDRSLLIAKATGAVPHTGGKRIEPDDPMAATIHDWIAGGATLDDADDSTIVDALTIHPPRLSIEGIGNRHRLAVVATMADGSTRDVTDMVAIDTQNAAVASVDPNDLAAGVREVCVRATGRGKTFVSVRYATAVAGIEVMTIPKDTPSPPEEVYDATHPIDVAVNAELRRLRIAPGAACDDETFLRRITIDAAGRLPTPAEIRSFRDDGSPDKRATLAKRLINAPEFSDLMADRFASLLKVRSTGQLSPKSAFLFGQWLHRRFRSGDGLDRIVRELLTAAGDTLNHPAATYFQAEPNGLKVAEDVAQAFMGIRTQCAQCHNHPFDRWTMDDYYGFAAFFCQVGRKRGGDPRSMVVFDRRGGSTKHPVGGAVVPPKYLGGERPETKGVDRRSVAADWLTSPDNPYFAPTVANRVWAFFMGRGNLHPVDDLRVSNPPANAELFDLLGRRFADSGFSLRAIAMDIVTSDAYARVSVSPEAAAGESSIDLRHFSHARVRRVPAETLADMIDQATGGASNYRGVPRGGGATEIPDGGTSTYMLTTFGRSPRTSACEGDASVALTLSQALHLITGEAVHQKIQKGGVVRRWVTKENRTDDQMINQLFLRTLSRRPTAEERESLIAGVSESEDRVAAIEDVFWALMNSREFLFNH